MKIANRRNILKTFAALSMTPMIFNIAYAGEKSGRDFARPEKSGLDLPVISGKRTLGSGQAAMEVSPIGFGVMGANYNRGVSPDKKTVIGVIRQAAEHGITLFDTAQIYGPLTNEKLAGEALAPYRGRVAITTKFGHKIVDGVYHKGQLDSSPANIRKVAEESLRSLGLDAIDLFYQHRFDPNVPIEDVAGTVKDLIREGKVRRFGLCEVGPETIRRAHAEQPVTAVQSEYHLMWREPEKDIFPVLEELGIGFVPYSPLNRGMLGGDFTAYTRFDSGNDNRDSLPRFRPDALGENLRVVETINRFARPRGITGAQAALGWLLQNDWIVPIPGTTKLSHLEENIRAANVALKRSDWQELENSLAKVRIVGDRYPAEQQRQVQKT